MFEDCISILSSCEYSAGIALWDLQADRIAVEAWDTVSMSMQPTRDLIRDLYDRLLSYGAVIAAENLAAEYCI